MIDGIQHTFDDKVKFVLRLHPEERQRLYIEKYGDDNFVFLDQPDGFRATETRGFGNKSAIIDFVSLMKFSDVVINLGSTTTLDAILFDTTVICPNFNPSICSSQWNAASKHF